MMQKTVLIIVSILGSLSALTAMKPALHCQENEHKKYQNACIEGDSFRMLELALISKDCTINYQNKTGATLLHYAAANGHDDVVDLLLQHNANVTLTDHYGQIPLLLAYKPSIITKLLWADQTTINHLNLCQKGLLINCVINPLVTVKDLYDLVKRGLNVHQVDSLGNNVMHYALAATTFFYSCPENHDDATKIFIDFVEAIKSSVDFSYNVNRQYSLKNLISIVDFQSSITSTCEKIFYLKHLGCTFKGEKSFNHKGMTPINLLVKNIVERGRFCSPIMNERSYNYLHFLSVDLNDDNNFELMSQKLAKLPALIDSTQAKELERKTLLTLFVPKGYTLSQMLRAREHNLLGKRF